MREGGPRSIVKLMSALSTNAAVAESALADTRASLSARLNAEIATVHSDIMSNRSEAEGARLLQR